MIDINAILDAEEPEVSVSVSTEEPEVAVNLDQLRWLVLRGMKGDTGKSAYALAVELGFVGTEAEWLASLKGAPGNPGTPGVSPTVTVASIEGGNRVTITDAAHPTGQTFDVMDGEDGVDGRSPAITVTAITGGHRVTITDETHPFGQSLDVMDGDPGDDYVLTPQDKVEIAGMVPVPTVPTEDISANTAARHTHENKAVLDGITVEKVQSWDGAGTYSKPSGGIPASDLADGVIPDISGKANAADVAALASRLNAIADSDDTTLDQLSEIVAYIKNNKSLIDNITTGKVSVSDIVDNLTSAETGKPLSANQGRVLKALIDAIDVPTESTVSEWGFTKNTGTYTKPNGGIPKTDLASDVKTSLGKADTALQSAPVTSVNTKTGAVVLSASDVGALPSSTSIPTKISDLTNDSGYQTEQDVHAAISGVRQLPTFPSIADIAELWSSVSKLPSGAWEDYAWHQCPEAVRNYIANVDYDGVAYSESSIGDYAPTPAVPATNTKPIGQAVDGVTFYNTRPGVSPYATENKSGVLNPLDQVRWINTAATNNFRDLGGWPCDGGTVKYGLLYRSGNLGAADEDLIVNQLGITVECDLTADGEPAYPDKMRFIGYTSYAMYSLANTGAWQTNLRGIFDAVCGGESVVFHCSMGADRTGTLACILEGLLGVSQSDIDKDYELTSFYSERARNGNYQGGTTDWAHLIAQILALEGDTFRDKCVTFVRSLGFTVAEINEYRRAMIDGNPEDLAAPTVTYTVTNTLTNCATNNRSSSADGGGVYAATITADSGYTLTGATVSITMGGTDITASAYSNGAITIANVTGNIVIQISAVVESRLKELFDASAATLNQRFNSSGGYSALNGNFCTDFIPVSGLNTSDPWRIHIREIGGSANKFVDGGNNESITYFKSDKTIMNTNYGRLGIVYDSSASNVLSKEVDTEGGVYIDINRTGNGSQIPSSFFDLSQVAYIRVCMTYSSGTEIPNTGTLANVSITADKITS